jgi:hypothetical protein
VRGTVLYGPRDIRFEERTAPTIMKPTDAIIRITATYVCGSHLWPYRGINRVAEPTFLHCLTGGARRLDHIWRGFASSIRTWQYRSANSTRLRRPADREGNLRAALPARGAYPSPLRRGHSPTTCLRSRNVIRARSRLLL